MKNESKLIKTEHRQFKTTDINEEFIQNSPTFCVAIDRMGKTILMNRAMLNALGYQEEDVIGKDYVDTIVPKKDHKLVREIFERHIEQNESTINENYVQRKDGELLSVEWHARPVLDKDGQYCYHLGVGIDITERKKIETALRASENHLHQVSGQLMAAEEKERNRISRELHDELGQALSILKLDIGSIMRKLLSDDQSDVYQECRRMRNYIDNVIENVRRLARDLSPTIIDDLGLDIALHELLASLSKYYEVKLSILCEGIDKLFLPEVKIAIYRVCQEILNNIVKHAHATQITVGIERRGEKLIIRITDNGVGLDTHRGTVKLSRNRGLGLAAIHERIRMLGGSVEFCGARGRGTQVTCVIPIKKEVSENGIV